MSAHRFGGRAWRAKEWSVPLVAYVVAQSVLFLASTVLPAQAAGLTNMLIVVIGTLVLTVRVARHRPEPVLGWALVAASSWTLMATAVVVSVAYGLRDDASIGEVLPLTLGALPFPVLAAGLALLSRMTPRRGPADVLDAAMTALAAFLLLWAILLDPLFTADITSVSVVIALPIGGLLVFAITVKLVLGGALRDPAVRLLLIGVAALMATMILVLVPALQTGALQGGGILSLLWMVFGVTLGAAGLHPSLTQRRYVVRDDASETSGRRLVLFAVLALVPPFVWGVELYRYGKDRHEELIAVTVPVVASAVFLLLLVVRLGLIARVSQRRAGQLARRSAALAAVMSEQEELQRQLSYRAMHDPLTGLHNRVVLKERMEWALNRRIGSGRHALLLLDLDQFKDINDTLGHPTGDEVLIEVSHRLLDATPSGATVARLGGDEFAVFLEDSDDDTALRRADVLLAAVRRTYAIDGRELYLTTSVGVLVTGAGPVARSSSEVLGDADLALYAAKAAGKNRAALFHTDLRTARLDHTRVSTGLRQALANEEFVLHYQPVVDQDAQAVAFVEALVRWQPPGRPLMYPTDFIPIAEDTGLITPLGTWVLRKACRDARRWHYEHRIALSVNVSGRQLDDPDFADTVIAALADGGLPGNALIIEVTEGNLLATSPTHARHGQLYRLRAHGVRIAIDHFGTGYSSLSHLTHLPVDIVKIDGSLTQSQDRSTLAPKDWSFTRAILQLVDSLHMLAVAEGVETAEQAQALRALNCPLVQGYHFSRPVPAAVLERTLAGADS